MYSRKVKCLSVAFAASLAALGSVSASSQTITKQVLDRVEVVSPNTVLDMAFDDPTQSPQFSLPVGVNIGNFTACQLTATQGLYCLDQNSLQQKGRLVRNWNPVAPSSDPALFTCEDSALGFDTSKSVETCTGITVGGDGAVFVSGKTKNLYSLVKVVEEASPGVCPASPGSGFAYARLNSEPPGGKQFCYAQLPGWKDRPLLVDLTATKAVISVTRPNGSTVRVQCSGVIGLEERKTLMFFPDPELNGTASDCGTAPVTIATSKSWGLQGQEQLQSATVIQTQADNPQTAIVEQTVTFALGTTSGGLIKAKDTSTPTTIATTAFNIPQERSGRSTSFAPKAICSTTGQQYGIRTNAKSDAVYVTDRNCGEVLALGPSVSSTGALLGLANLLNNTVDQTLSTCLDPSTCSDSSGFYPALQPTLAPGDSIDLNDCGFDASGQAKTCTIAKSEFGNPAATLTKVNVVSTPSGLTLFQIQNMPDCRWLALDKPAELPAICNGAIVGGVPGQPWTQYLDVSRLLPKEVTDQFIRKPLNPNYPATSTNPLNPMYLSPAYRAQVRGIPVGVPVKDTEITPSLAPAPPVPPRYYFDAFFGITEQGVIFADTFDMTLEVQDLAGGGTKLGCTPDGTTTYPSSTWPVPMSWLLQWDVSVRISEYDLTVGGPSSGLTYTDMLVNNGCGSGKNSSPSWSMFIFNLEMSENPTPVVDSNLEVPRELEITFAQQVVSLFYKDLYDALKQTACSALQRADGAQLQPAFTSSTCTTLYNQWNGARDKLEKCISGSDFPKTSEAVRNCQSFNSQLDGLEASLLAVPRCQKSQTQANPGTCIDQANRRGEMLSRVMTLRDVFNNKFLPSVPSNGFVSTGYNTLYPLALRPPF